MTTQNERVFYAIPEMESPVFGSIQAAVIWHLDGFVGATRREALNLSRWPLEVDEFRPVPKPKTSRVLDWVLSNWDDECNLAGSGTTEQTPELLKLTQALVDKLPVTDYEATGKTVTVTKDEAAAMLGGAK